MCIYNSMPHTLYIRMCIYNTHTLYIECKYTHKGKKC